MAEIVLDGVRKRFGDFVAVKGADVRIHDGEFFVMLGPSGCGKTTILRMMAGLELPSEGRILLGEEDVTHRRPAQRDIAFMFQLYALYPHMNVRGNIEFPLKCQGVRRTLRRERALETAEFLRITHLLDRPVSGLAGGDRQRVALARAIVRRPQAFLMDEPLGALDTEFRELMCRELASLHQRLKTTIVYVTHDQVEAMSMADRIMVMNHGEIEQIGTPQEVYDNPSSMYVAAFLGSPPMCFLSLDGPVQAEQVTLQLDGQTRREVPWHLQAPRPGPIAVGMRPEHVSLTDGGDLRGEVVGTEYMGTNQVVTVETSLGEVKARVQASRRVSLGENVGLRCPAESLVLFDAASGRALAAGETRREVRIG